MRQVLGVIGVTLLAAACGKAPVKIVEPKPKEIVVGQKGHFVLDADESSAVIRGGTLDVEVKSVSDLEVGIEGRAAVKTLIGPKEFTIASSIEAGILTREWTAQLRDVKTYQAKKAFITHEGITTDGCDRVRLSGIEGYPSLAIEPTVCLQTRTVPSVAVFFTEAGQVFTAMFRADE
jgi:hypothetical protein